MSSAPSTGSGGILRRHRCYRHLLGLCLLLLLGLTLPRSWNRLTVIGYELLPLVILTGLGDPFGRVPFGRLARRLFRGLGLACMAATLIWYLSPAAQHSSGLLILVLWTAFVGWSTVRLVRGLAQEPAVNGAVLMGAFAGYLLMGITAGLLFSAMETLHSGSFDSIHSKGLPLLSDHSALGGPVWQLDFIRLNYFALVSLTTVGFGDIYPVTPQAQMASVAVSVVGTLYLAVVMGLLISRYTVQGVEEEEEEEQHQAGRSDTSDS